MPRKIRQIRVEGNIAYVPLTRGYEAVIDVADVPLVSSWNWHVLPHPNTTYAMRKGAGSPRKTILMHRVIMGDPEGLDVDHKDGDGLNNLRINLRVATHSQNRCNQRISKSNTSGFKGVSRRKTGKWKAQIMVGRRSFYLGLYDTPEAAHAAYIAASVDLHGEYGRPV